MARAAPVIVIHGGAGARIAGPDVARRRQVMLAAVKAGAASLKQGAGALEAAVAAVVALEDNALFNAGYGSVLNVDGAVEMDASVMVGGNDSRGAGVAAVRGVRNPILLAKAVMERTPHVLIVGDGARRLARAAGLECCRPQALISERARLQWQALRADRARARGAARLKSDGSRFSAARGAGEAAQARAGAAMRGATVGAIALDTRGGLAAATSTGGIAGKLAGRVGDSAIIGAGTFANASGAASATGAGEAILKAGLCRVAVCLLRAMGPQRAVSRAISELAKTNGGRGGIILLDSRGRYACAHNARAMDVACFDPVSEARFFAVRPTRS